MENSEVHPFPGPRALEFTKNIAQEPRAPFALSAESPSPALGALYEIMEGLQDDMARIELSRISRRKLRELFPAGSGRRGRARLRNGLEIEVDLGDLFGAELYLGNLNEAAVLNAVTALIPEGARIVDVGANFGLYSLHAAHASGAESRVVAFEPLPSAFDLLEANIASNDLKSQITPVNAAVSRKSGRADFFAAEDGAFSGLHDTQRSPHKSRLKVKLTTLDQNKAVAQLGSVDFLKIDVEGHEGDVLAGAREMIRKSPAILIALEYSNKNVTETLRESVVEEIDFLLSSGFRGLVVEKPGDATPLIEGATISRTMSGNVFLAGPDCAWFDDLALCLGKRGEHIDRVQFEAIAIILAELRQTRGELLSLDALAKEIADDDEDKTAALSKRVQRYVAKLKRTLGRAETENAALKKQKEHVETHFLLSERNLREKTEALAATLDTTSSQLAAHRELADKLQGELILKNEEYAALTERVSAFREMLSKKQVKKFWICGFREITENLQYQLSDTSSSHHIEVLQYI